MFSSKHSVATLYVAGVFDGSHGLVERVQRHGFKAGSIFAGLGFWHGQTEMVYKVEIAGETAAPAHMAIAQFSETDKARGPVLLPADDTAFESNIRTLAE